MNDAIGPPLTFTLPLQIAERISAAIVDEQFEEGERLIEVDLAARFGVSRATIRETLRILENRGLVTILPQRGARINSLSRKELEDMFEIRAVLLGLASRRVAETFTPEAERRMVTLINGLKAARRSQIAYARASSQTAREITRLSGNPQLADHITMFATRVDRYTGLGLHSQERRDRSFSNWQALLQAMVAGDGSLAESIHRRLSRENSLAALEELDRRAIRAEPSKTRKEARPKKESD